MSRYKIVMLPTNEASQLYIDSNGYLQIGFNIQRTLPDVSQHLYIVDTKATVNVGDWFVSEVLNVHKKTSEWAKNTGKIKIIASTDVSFGLPTIPETYIQDLINHIDSPILKYEIHGGCFIPFIDYHYKERNKPQVDFDLLKYTLSQIKQGYDISQFYDERANLQRFFELEEVKRIINNLQV